VVNGRLTLYGQSNITWAVPITLDLIRLTLDDGGLDDVNPDVVDVSFRREGIPTYDFGSPADWLDDDGGGGGDGGGADELGGSIGSDPKTSAEAWPWVVLGGGLFVLLAALAMLRRRIRRNSDTDGYEEASRTVPPGDTAETYLQDDDNRYRTSSREAYSPNFSPSSPNQLWFDDEDSEYSRRRHFL